MEKKHYQILLLGLLLALSRAHAQDVVYPEPLTHLSFGSCNKTSIHPEVWATIAEQQAQVWVWLGDIVYGKPNALEDLSQRYKKQLANPHYQQLKQHAKVFGIWDDHDYGPNDGGSDYALKEESRELLFNFLELPTTHPARQRHGAYQAYSFGSGAQKVLLVLLDNRYFKEPYKKNPDPKQRYYPNAGLLLGETQWEWLDDLLASSDARVHLFGSGIQFLSDQHPYEKWENYPKAKARMQELILKYNLKNPVFLTGDRHIAELSKTALSPAKTVYDFTSSGITHSYDVLQEEANSHRISPLIVERNFGQLFFDWTKSTMRFELTAANGKSLYQSTHSLE